MCPPTACGYITAPSPGPFLFVLPKSPDKFASPHSPPQYLGRYIDLALAKSQVSQACAPAPPPPSRAETAGMTGPHRLQPQGIHACAANRTLAIQQDRRATSDSRHGKIRRQKIIGLRNEKYFAAQKKFAKNT